VENNVANSNRLNKRTKPERTSVNAKSTQPAGSAAKLSYAKRAENAAKATFAWIHEDKPEDIKLQWMHDMCKQEYIPRHDKFRSLTKQELQVLDAVLAGNLALDTIPGFLVEVMTVDEQLIFHQDMQASKAYLRIGFKGVMTKKP
jgi:hypothetical protein